MSDIKIHTNNHRYPILYWRDLTEKEKEDFDWILTSSTVTTEDAEFVRYKGNVYCLQDFMRFPHQENNPYHGWSGYQSDSFFSGVLIKYLEDEFGYFDTDHVVMGWYYAS